MLLNNVSSFRLSSMQLNKMQTSLGLFDSVSCLPESILACTTPLLTSYGLYEAVTQSGWCVGGAASAQNFLANNTGLLALLNVLYLAKIIV